MSRLPFNGCCESGHRTDFERQPPMFWAGFGTSTLTQGRKRSDGSVYDSYTTVPSPAESQINGGNWNTIDPEWNHYYWFTEGTISSDQQQTIQKYTRDGTLVWEWNDTLVVDNDFQNGSDIGNTSKWSVRLDADLNPYWAWSYTVDAETPNTFNRHWMQLKAVKLDKDTGAEVWSATRSLTTNRFVGSGEREGWNVYDWVVLPNGNLVVVGSRRFNDLAGPGFDNHEHFIWVIDSDGNEVSYTDNTPGTTAGDANSFGTIIEADSAGNYHMVYRTRNSAGTPHFVGGADDISLVGYDANNSQIYTYDYSDFNNSAIFTNLRVAQDQLFVHDAAGYLQKYTTGVDWWDTRAWEAVTGYGSSQFVDMEVDQNAEVYLADSGTYKSYDNGGMSKFAFTTFGLRGIHIAPGRPPHFIS